MSRKNTFLFVMPKKMYHYLKSLDAIVYTVIVSMTKYFLIKSIRDYTAKKVSSSINVSVVVGVSFTILPFSSTTILLQTSTVCCKS